jgi:hypothetical protein
MNFKLGTGFTLDSTVSGKCEDGQIVTGKLSMVSAEIIEINGLRVERGYYISNSAGRPFAYKVKGETLNIIGNSK